MLTRGILLAVLLAVNSPSHVWADGARLTLLSGDTGFLEQAERHWPWDAVDPNGHLPDRTLLHFALDAEIPLGKGLTGEVGLLGEYDLRRVLTDDSSHVGVRYDRGRSSIGLRFLPFEGSRVRLGRPYALALAEDASLGGRARGGVTPMEVGSPVGPTRAKKCGAHP